MSVTLTELNPKFSLSRDAAGRLIVTDAHGRLHENVEPVRAFPISDPEHWISLCDTSGHEIAQIRDLQEMADNQRELLQTELTRREFVPVIQRIISISSLAEPCEWVVETDRGATTFVLNSDEHVRKLGDEKALILDSHGLRYLVPDAKQLDATSRKLLARYLS
ncbi:MAG: DUF1854 domain-containing protein [Planctomycetia bacterium]|nr:DUF1854 domain-containing protein [Planctomycetia bacterium]